MYALAIFLPLIGAAIAGLGQRWLGHRGAQIVTCAGMTGSALLGIAIFIDVAIGGNTRTIELFTWIASDAFEATWSIRLDQLAAVMVGMVSLISCLIHFYSIGYMHDDPGVPRFMAYLSLFTFF